jgi:hypothetical protein
MDLEAKEWDNPSIIDPDSYLNELRSNDNRFQELDRVITEALKDALTVALRNGEILHNIRPILGNRKFKPYLDKSGITKTRAYGYIYIYRNQDEIKRLVQSGLSLKKAVELFKKANKGEDPKQEKLQQTIPGIETYDQQIRRSRPRSEEQKFKDNANKIINKSHITKRITESSFNKVNTYLDDKEKRIRSELKMVLDTKEETKHWLIIKDVKRKE